MTAAVFFQRGDRLTGFSVSGHTDDSGSPQARLVCAAVSSAVYLAVNTLTDVIGAKADVQLSDGALSFHLKSDTPRAEDMVRGLQLRLSQLAEQYRRDMVINTEGEDEA